MAKRGAKSKYNPEVHLILVGAFARKGFTVDEIAKAIGVAKNTLRKWVNENDDLLTALKEGREVADATVENSLYKRANGMTIKEKKTIIINDANGKPTPKIEVIEKDVPPDVTACIFWLNNRNPKEWRDMQVIEAGFEDLTPLADMLKINNENDTDN